MQVPAEKIQKMVSYIEKTQPIIEKAAQIEAEVAKLAPTVVDILIKRGALELSQRDRAVVNIQNPVRALESLRKLAEEDPKSSKPESMGEPAGTAKVASAGGNGTEGKLSEADRAFLASFGL